MWAFCVINMPALRRYEMTIAYIKEEKKTNFFQGVEIENFENNYVITIYDKKKNRVKNKLVKYIKKFKIDTLVFSEDLKEYKEEICKMMQDYIVVINGRKVMEFLQFDIMKYILEMQNKDIRQEEVYIVFKKDNSLDLNFLKIFIENFRMTNIVTNDLERLKNVQDNLLYNDNILISVSNNKKKALKRAKYILNVNLSKEELEKYRINREAIIVNIKEDVQYDDISFAGINVRYLEIEFPDEYLERFERLGTKFDNVKLYESVLLKERMDKRKMEEVQERIKNDGVRVTALIGNNGILDLKS